MTTGNDVTIVMEAQDRAGAKVRQLGRTLRTDLVGGVASAAKSMFGLTAIISAVGLSITVLIALGKQWFENSQATTRAITSLRREMLTFGFSTERANSTLTDLRNNLTRTTVQALAGLTSGFAEFAALMPSTQVQIQEAAVKLAELADIDYKEAFDALNEGLTGNMQPMADLGFVGDDLHEVMGQINDDFQFMLDNESELESLWRKLGSAMKGFGEVAATVINEFIEDVDRIFSPDSSLSERLVAWFDLAGASIGIPNLGTNLIGIISSAIDQVVDFFSGGQNTNEEDNFGAETQSGFGKLGSIFGSQIVGGLFRFLLGDTAVDVITAAWQGNWDLVWAILKDKVPEWGKQIGTAIRDGLINFVLGDSFGQNFIDALNSEAGLKGAIAGLAGDARTWGFDLGVAIGNGLISAIEAAIKIATDFINKWISRVESVLNSIKGVNVSLPRVDPIEIPRLGQQSISQGGGPGRDRMQAPLVLMVNGREFARATIEVMDRQIRILQPGLGIG